MLFDIYPLICCWCATQTLFTWTCKHFVHGEVLSHLQRWVIYWFYVV